MNIIEFAKEERINFVSIKRQIEREEIKFYNKLVRREKLSFSFTLDKFEIKYNSLKIDHNTNLISYDFDIHCKNFDDSLAENMFKKYGDIIVTDFISDEQLIRKRKMQQELQMAFGAKHRNTILNMLLYNRFLFPIVTKRYWLKMFLHNFDMGYIGTPDSNTPLIKLKGTFVISLEHFMKDLKRMNYIKVLSKPLTVDRNSIFKNVEIKMDFRLPKLFFMYSNNRLKDIILDNIKKDFDTKGTRFTNFWRFIVLDTIKNNIYQIQEVKWKDETTIDIQYIISSMDKLQKMGDLKKAAIALGGAMGAEAIINKLKKDQQKEQRLREEKERRLQAIEKKKLEEKLKREKRKKDQENKRSKK
jgi:hypothetical protein